MIIPRFDIDPSRKRNSAMPETTASPSKLERFVAKYREDHRHPVNHVLHVGVGWPMCAAAVIPASAPSLAFMRRKYSPTWVWLWCRELAA